MEIITGRNPLSRPRSDFLAELNDFVSVRRDRFPVLYRAQAQVAAAFDFQMAVEMLDALDHPLALPHARAGTQRDRVAPLPGGNARMRLWQGVWWEMTFVTLAIFVLVLVFNHLADELRDILDPALRNERN